MKEETRIEANKIAALIKDREKHLESIEKGLHSLKIDPKPNYVDAIAISIKINPKFLGIALTLEKSRTSDSLLKLKQQLKEL